MTIKKLGSAYKFRVGRATGNEHIFLFGLIMMIYKLGFLVSFLRNHKTACKIGFELSNITLELIDITLEFSDLPVIRIYAPYNVF